MFGYQFRSHLQRRHRPVAGTSNRCCMGQCYDDVVALVKCKVRPAHEFGEMWHLQERGREGVGA